MSGYRDSHLSSPETNGFVDIDWLHFGLGDRGILPMKTAFPLVLLLALAAWIIVLATAFSLGGMMG